MGKSSKLPELGVILITPRGQLYPFEVFSSPLAAASRVL